MIGPKTLHELEMSVITMPRRNGWTMGWSPAEVRQIATKSKAVALAVDSAGGAEQFSEKTRGGLIPPEQWPFDVLDAVEPVIPEEPKLPWEQESPGMNPVKASRPEWAEPLFAQLDRIERFVAMKLE